MSSKLYQTRERDLPPISKHLEVDLKISAVLHIFNPFLSILNLEEELLKLFFKILFPNNKFWLECDKMPLPVWCTCIKVILSFQNASSFPKLSFKLTLKGHLQCITLLYITVEYMMIDYLNISITVTTVSSIHFYNVKLSTHFYFTVL